MFVCMGNTCRSPMAEYLFRDLCEKEGLDVTAISRGMMSFQQAVYQANPQIREMSKEAISALRKYNPSLKGLEDHLSQPVTDDDLKKSDLILTVETGQRDGIIDDIITYLKQRKYKPKKPRKARRIADRKVFTLKEYVGKFDDMEIKDPICAGSGSKVVYSPAQNQKNTKSWLSWLTKCFTKTKKVSYPKYDKAKAEREKEKVYEDCRDEILECLQMIINEIKQPSSSGIPTVKDILSRRKEEAAKKSKQSISAKYTNYP